MRGKSVIINYSYGGMKNRCLCDISEKGKAAGNV